MTSADAASGTMRTVRFHENGEPGDVLRLESAAVRSRSSAACG